MLFLTLRLYKFIDFKNGLCLVPWDPWHCWHRQGVAGYDLRGKWKEMLHCWKFCLWLRPSMTPLMALIAQITKKGKSWKLLKLLLFHACLLPAFWLAKIQRIIASEHGGWWSTRRKLEQCRHFLKLHCSLYGVHSSWVFQIDSIKCCDHQRLDKKPIDMEMSPFTWTQRIRMEMNWNEAFYPLAGGEAGAGNFNPRPCVPPSITSIGPSITPSTAAAAHSIICSLLCGGRRG